MCMFICSIYLVYKMSVLRHKKNIFNRSAAVSMDLSAVLCLCSCVFFFLLNATLWVCPVLVKRVLTDASIHLRVRFGPHICLSVWLLCAFSFLLRQVKYMWRILRPCTRVYKTLCTNKYTFICKIHIHKGDQWSQGKHTAHTALKLYTLFSVDTVTSANIITKTPSIRPYHQTTSAKNKTERTNEIRVLFHVQQCHALRRLHNMIMSAIFTRFWFYAEKMRQDTPFFGPGGFPSFLHICMSLEPS